MFWNTVVDFVEANKTVNYQNIAIVFAIYALALWGIVCLWVLNDAWPRYKQRSKFYAVLWTLATFILNVPCFILYLTFRPDHEWEEIANIFSEETEISSELHKDTATVQVGNRKYHINYNLKPTAPNSNSTNQPSHLIES